jgi:uncharacterized protein YdbL (DUF1318 family)
MKISNLFYSALISVIALTISFSANALDLQQARSQGIIGEQADGFVKVLKASAEAEKLANEVNAARKQEYQRISKENGQPVDVVGKVAAVEIAKKLGK